MRPIEAFLGDETAGAALLFAAAIVALIWANLPGETYGDLWGREFGRNVGDLHLQLTLGKWVNDALMSIFFLVVGLEIRRELTRGELSDRRSAALPIAAAAGGMIVPALIYTSINIAGDGTRGWGIPMATDIAFAVGALALLGRRVPLSLRAFLLGLAIVDDIGGILVIALFYTENVGFGWLACGAGLLGLTLLFARFGVRSAGVYAALAALAWVAIHESGVHATVAGVLTAFVLPVRYGDAASHSSAVDAAEDLLHPWSSFAVVPLFALANAGVDLSGGVLGDALSSPVALGVVAALVLGKPAGILFFSLIAMRLGVAWLPEGVGARHIAGAGLLAGIGFTVSIFIAALAFDDAALIAEAKIGVLSASIVAGIAGYGALRLLTNNRGVGE